MGSSHISPWKREPAAALAVEPDRRKIFLTVPGPALRVVNGYHAAVAGRFDAVTLFDVLYGCRAGEWDALFRSGRAAAGPGRGFPDQGARSREPGQAALEPHPGAGSDRIGLTLGEAFSYETREEIRARFARAGFAGFEAVEIGAGYPHAHVLYIGRAAGD